MNFDINKIPHINEIANNGSFNGARSKNTETFQQRCSDCNKIVPSLEEAIKKFVPDVNNDFKRLIEECQKSFTLEQPSIIIEEYIQECELIYQNYEKCYHLYDKLKKIDNINDSKEIMKKIDELYMTSERSFSGTLITDASSMDADQILEEMYSGITNKEKYSKEDLNSIADKGMQIAEIFMKNARETKELFEESLKGL